MTPPSILAPKFDAIPAALKELAQWVTWESVRPKKPGDKWGKIPHQPDGRHASSTDPDTWSSFDQVRDAYETRRNDPRGFAGVGFVVANGDGFVGVDLDHAFDENGDLKPEFREIVEALDSYTERSPSGTGIRIWCRGTLPPRGRKCGDIEMYCHARFLTVTGLRIGGTKISDQVEERTEQLAALHAKTFPPKEPPAPRAVQGDPLGGPLTDSEILTKASQAKDAAKFNALWAGDTSGYPGQSEADQALCSILSFWCQGDAAQIDRLFRQSGLMRPKWDESRGALTYGERTIENVTVGRTEFYSPNPPQAEKPRGRPKKEKPEPEADPGSPTPKDDEIAPEPETPAQRDSAALQLIRWARAHFELWRAPGGRTYATALHGVRRTMAIESTEMRRAMLSVYIQTMGKPATPSAIKTAVETLDALASMGETHPVHTRVAFVEKAGPDRTSVIYVDLCTADWTAVKITRDGWEVTADVPVRFRRTGSMLPQVEPARGGKLSHLLELLNVSEAERVLIWSWVIACFGPKRSYPILGVNGEQGSGKSSASRMLQKIIDPTSTGLRRLPYELEDLAVAVHSSHLTALDNLSGINNEFADAICTISTGGSFNRRARFTDLDESANYALNPLLLNGIGEPSTRPDMLDRMILITLVRPEERRTEADLDEMLAERLPLFLGALFDCLAAGLRHMAETSAPSDLRMADAARWIIACEHGAPWEPGTFVDCYRSNRDQAVEIALEGSATVDMLRQILDEEQVDAETRQIVKARGEWTGNSAGLLDQMKKRAENNKAIKLPANPRALSIELKRLGPALMAIGIRVEDRLLTGKRLYTITTFEPPKDLELVAPPEPVAATPPAPEPPAPEAPAMPTIGPNLRARMVAFREAVGLRKIGEARSDEYNTTLQEYLDAKAAGDIRKAQGALNRIVKIVAYGLNEAAEPPPQAPGKSPFDKPTPRPAGEIRAPANAKPLTSRDAASGDEDDLDDPFAGYDTQNPEETS